MKRRTPCALCGVTLGVLAAIASAQGQAKTHDALAVARHTAAFENQRVLLYLTGGKAEVDTQLAAAMFNYRTLGKLLKYEYQLAAMPAHSLAGTALRKRLGLQEIELPALVALNTEDQVVGRLPASKMLKGDQFEAGQVREFLETHKCAPRNARKVLAEGLARAKKDQRDVFVYLSAPW